MRTFAAVAASIALGTVMAPAALAQSQLRFEVASVKADKAAERGGGPPQFLAGGRFVARNIPLEMLIQIAYDIPFQSFGTPRLSGGPDWIRSERFSVEAKAAAGAVPQGLDSTERERRMREMLKALLADRFKLAMHTDIREMPVYAIVVAKNGPKLERSPVTASDCERLEADLRPGPPLNRESLPCHRIVGGQGRGIHAKAATVSDVAVFVANWTDKPVVDQTGLNGLYRLDTEGWVPMRPPQILPGTQQSAEQQAMADPSRPTLFMIFDRLGLKLEPSRAPIEMYTIEHVERPMMEN